MEGDRVTGYSYRPLRLPADGAMLDQLNTSFEGDSVYAVSVTDHGIAWRLKQAPPFTKTYDLSEWRDSDRLWDQGWVAETTGQIVGFVGFRVEDWNRRCIIWHLYVDSAFRRQGIARNLLRHAAEAGQRLGAQLLWLEVTNVNVAAIATYRALGFQICGVDATLYQCTDAPTETALFMARPIE